MREQVSRHKLSGRIDRHLSTGVFLYQQTTMYLNLYHQQLCITRPMVPSAMMGTLFTGLNIALQGAPLSSAPKMLLFNTSGIYLYHILQCPMEAINDGRPSAWHNVLSGGIIGFLGVRAGYIGVPFVDYYFFVRHPQISPPLAGAAVYGGMAGLLATMGGKPF